MSSTYLILVVSLFLFSISGIEAIAPLAFLTRRKQPAYTPLIFFKTPLGMDPASDAAERLVRRIERETGTRVERIDVLRNPKAQALLELINQSFNLVGDDELPVLYHRESRQLLRGSDVTERRVRAWAKGRLVRVENPGTRKKMVAKPRFIEKSAAAAGDIDPELLAELEKMALTTEQREGKRLIEERTEALASK